MSKTALCNRCGQTVPLRGQTYALHMKSVPMQVHNIGSTDSGNSMQVKITRVVCTGTGDYALN